MSEPITSHEEEVLGKAYDSRLMRRLLSYVRPYGGMTFFSLVLILLSSLLQLVGPLVTAIAVDLFIRPSGGAPASEAASSRVRALLLSHGWDPARIANDGLLVAAGFYLAAVVLTF